MLHIFKRTRLSYNILWNIRCITTESKIDSRKLDNSEVVFGTLSERGKQALIVSEVNRYYPDDKDGYDKEEFDLTPRKNFYYYNQEISKYARKGPLGLKKALQLFSDMKSKDRLTPTIHNFSPLIYGCAKAGYTKKAFDLYKESLNYYKKPSRSMITCLINACAESPFQEYAIKRLDWFREHLKFEYNYTLNEIQYRSAIKAYGKLGQLEKASKLVKEMIENNILPDTETFNMLLIGCASNKESGATIALRLYKRLKYYNLKPNIITFRLMLRCIRDCGLGSGDLLEKTIGELPALVDYNQKIRYKKLLAKQSDSSRKKSNQSLNFEWLPLVTELGDCIVSATSTLKNELPQDHDIKLIQSNPQNAHTIIIKKEDNYISKATSNYQLISNHNHLPNLLSEDHMDLLQRIQGIHFDKLRTAYDRLLMFGGLHGYLETIQKEGCKPDNKTFSLLLQCIKHNKNSQVEYLRLAKDYKINRDLLFYDLLIRHICSNVKDSSRLSRALDLIDEMQADQIRPNITTFESLALGCDTWFDAKKLVSDVEHCGFTISNVMINAFFKTAITKKDYRYLIKLISLSIEKNYRPTKNLVESLEGLRISNRDLIVEYEKGILKDKPDWLDEEFIKQHDVFSLKLKSWLKSVSLQPEEHPWAQFYVESTAKRMGYRNFVEQFKKLENVKEEALSKSEDFGILAEKAGLS